MIWIYIRPKYAAQHSLVCNCHRDKIKKLKTPLTVIGCSCDAITVRSAGATATSATKAAGPEQLGSCSWAAAAAGLGQLVSPSKASNVAAAASGVSPSELSGLKENQPHQADEWPQDILIKKWDNGVWIWYSPCSRSGYWLLWNGVSAGRRRLGRGLETRRRNFGPWVKLFPILIFKYHT